MGLRVGEGVSDWWSVLVAAAQCDDLSQAAHHTPVGWSGAAAVAYSWRVQDRATWAAQACHALAAAARAWREFGEECLRWGQLPDPAARALMLGDSSAAVVAALARLHPDAWLTSHRPGGAGRPDLAPDLARSAWQRLGSAADPAGVAAWWQSLSDAQRDALLVAMPGVIGSLPGLPAAVRDLANRLVLHRDLSALGWREQRGPLSDSQRRTLRLAQSTDEALADHTGALLYGFDPSAFDGDGSVSVFTSDPADAEHVAVLVPGFTTDADDLDEVLDRAEWVDHEAEGYGDDVAVLAWLGYDAPDNLLGDGDAWQVLTADAADDGGALLAGVGAGIVAGDQPAHLTVIGHSYGSTTAGLAVAHHGLEVDDLILVGSPGAGPGVDSAAHLGTAGQVWVGANSRDPVADLGDHGWWGSGDLGAGLGHDPAAEEFGAIRFHSESVADAPTGAIAVHGSYFDPGSESLANIGAIVAGHPGQVGHADGVRDPWWGSPRDPEADRSRRGR